MFNPSFFKIIEAKAAVNLTISIGVRLSPVLPPIVPLIPDIDLINDTKYDFLFNNLTTILYENSFGLVKLTVFKGNYSFTALIIT